MSGDANDTSQLSRVLIVTHHSAGLEAPQVGYLAEFLSCSQWAVDLLGPIDEAYRPPGLRILRVGHGRSRNVVLLLLGLWMCATRRYDLVIGLDEAGTAVALVAKCLGLKARVALYFLDLFLDIEGSRFTRLGRRMLRLRGKKADVIIDTNEERSEFRREFVGDGPVYAVLHNAPPRSQQQTRSCGGLPQTENQEEGLRLIYTGSVHVAACLDQVIRALAQVQIPIRLSVVGWGTEEHVKKLKALATACNCSDRIVFVGPVPRERLAAIAASADAGLALYPCSEAAPLNERLCSPNKVYEYMAAGLPVITNNSPSMVSLVQKKGWGLCVPPNEPSAIAAAVEQLGRNPRLRRIMSARAVELHKTCMNFQYQADQLLPLLLGFQRQTTKEPGCDRGDRGCPPLLVRKL
jgi:glycosyltransferase involved in cell wall biosynthesis